VTSESRFVLLPDATPDAVPLWIVAEGSQASWLAQRTAAEQAWLASHDFRPERGRVLLVPGAEGRPAFAVSGLGALRPTAPAFDPWLAALLADRLPAGTYALAEPLAPEAATSFALGWLLGQYRFARYRKSAAPRATLVAPKGADAAFALAAAEALAFARDLINTPPNDMGPAELAAAAAQIASDAHGECRIVQGDALREQFPLVHAVGGGAAPERAPRLVDLFFARPGAPRVTLVGKGVCFDTGGLDIKPSSGMLLMKKDMGGAANVLALARMVMDAKLKVRLRVLIPAVENAVSGNAFRPLDVFPSRKGLTVEIGNTDAEGRLVLADALTLACEEKPDLLIDLGTLTGAARVALGPDLPPFYTNDEALAADVTRHAQAENDPLWRLPLWQPYDAWLDSKVADLNNAPSGGFAGSITCALFMQRFVTAETRWLHADIYGWTPKAKPGRPEGGECQGARAFYKLLSERYG